MRGLVHRYLDLIPRRGGDDVESTIRVDLTEGLLCSTAKICICDLGHGNREFRCLTRMPLSVLLDNFDSSAYYIRPA